MEGRADGQCACRCFNAVGTSRSGYAKADTGVRVGGENRDNDEGKY